jgi:uncharacterized protein (DUF4415 family)
MMCHPDRSEAKWRDLLFQLLAQIVISKNLCRELRLDADVIAWLKKDGKGY